LDDARTFLFQPLLRLFEPNLNQHDQEAGTMPTRNINRQGVMSKTRNSVWSANPIVVNCPAEADADAAAAQFPGRSMPEQPNHESARSVWHAFGPGA